MARRAAQPRSHPRPRNAATTAVISCSGSAPASSKPTVQHDRPQTAARHRSTFHKLPRSQPQQDRSGTR